MTQLRDLPEWRAKLVGDLIELDPIERGGRIAYFRSEGEGDTLARALIVAAINALPALLDVADAAQAVDDARRERYGYVPRVGATPMTDPSMAAMTERARKANDALRTALAALKEAK